MKHWKNWNKHITPLLLAVAMLVLPMGAAFFNDENAITVKAEDGKGDDAGKPTVSAAIQNGLLSIQAQAGNSGIRAIHVNGYEFTDITEGALNIRLQQFDTGYQYFTIQAADQAGNLSEVYKVSNPYYTEPQTEQGNSSDSESSVGQLPQSASATAPTEAKATVTEHTDTVESGIGNNGDTAEAADAAQEQSEDGGKEFYTIQTDSEKVFYLIINKEQTEDNVYLLTEVSENDLLNFTEGTTQTLPQNAATSESALPGGSIQPDESEDTDGTGEPEDTKDSGGEESQDKEEGNSNTGTYAIMAVVLLAVGGAYYYFKIARGRQTSFEMEEDEDEEEEEAYESEEDDGENLEE